LQDWKKASRADALLVPVTVRAGRAEQPILADLPNDVRPAVASLVRRYRAGKAIGSVDDQILPAGSRWGCLALVSLGEKSPPMAASVRQAAGQAASWCARHQSPRIAVAMDVLTRLAGDGAAAAWTEGAVLGSFRYEERRSRPPEDAGVPLVRMAMLTAAPRRNSSDAVRRARDVAECVNLARWLGHEPPNIINPVTLADWTRRAARRYGLSCRILDERQLRARRMGALLAVGGGSATRPRVIVLEHAGAGRSARPLVLVGKAVTLDTGGYSIKPGASIPEMKYDKCGGVAVIATLIAAARLKLPRRIVGVIGAAENMISGEAYRPGDIVRSASGRTIEIVDTDAEGRLILADCLHYAEQTFRPAAMVDLATLTGACTVALGEACAGLMSTSDALARELLEAGERTGELLWRLPLLPAYREQLASTEADIKNVGGRPAGAITAAMFLKEFVGERTPWAHLDIAGVAATTKPLATCPVGATGFGVRLLIDYIQRLS
jgi:leucyl aminopeptidase